MRFFFIILPLFLFEPCSSQSHKTIAESETHYPPADSLPINDFNKDLFICEFPPQPSVDWEKWTAYLNKTLELDSASVDTIPVGSHTVSVQFRIGANGKLEDITVLKNPGYGLSQRVIKSISNCRGIWKPARLDVRIIKEYRRQSITFLIEEEEKCENKLPAALML